MRFFNAEHGVKWRVWDCNWHSLDRDITPAKRIQRYRKMVSAVSRSASAPAVIQAFCSAAKKRRAITKAN